MGKQYKIRRWIRAYDKNGIKLLFQYELPSNISLELLQNLFGEPKDELMYGCYDLYTHQAKYLQEYVPDIIDLEKYDYFLECTGELIE